jgi:molybdenum cofactor synthesis domain-containing protein
MQKRVTAALLVIGEEILTGRTKDKNIGWLAETCSAIGLDLKEVRIVPDAEDAILAALNALRQKWDYLFTTGGIGPTHDDITAECVAKALGVPLHIDQRAVEKLRERYTKAELTPARLRMARIPEGAELIDNPVSKAPGFRIGNIIVMAGVPTIMQAMMSHVITSLKTSIPVQVETIEAGAIREGDYADSLGKIASCYPSLSIGSYPSFTTLPPGFASQIVIRGTDFESIKKAKNEIYELLSELKN